MIQSLRDIDVDSLNGVERIVNAADLPPPTNGTHTLVDETVYWFGDFVTSPATSRRATRSTCGSQISGVRPTSRSAN